MSRRKVKINDFGDALSKILEDYGDNFSEKMHAAVLEAAEIAKQETKAGAPTKSGKYKRGWTVKENAASRLRTEAIVHNRTAYQLAHLLEKGHALKKGGRSIGQVAPIVHIKPAEEHAIKNMEKAVEEIAKQR